VHGYLEDFLFPPDRARSKVKALSGGERSRLLLARLFTRPANVLVLDEPTNDLDIETLELLESKLAEFAGTVLIVSHDREFLDNVVTSTLVFEGGGRIGEFVGGYEDWLRQRGAAGAPAPSRPSTAQAVSTPAAAPKAAAKPAPKPAPKVAAKAAPKKKLSFKEQQELAALPARIEALEAEEQALQARAASPDFYKDGAEAIRQTLARIEAIGPERERALARWVELDERA
jgi:ATP-binding cassette subfamily F protein uup